MWALVTLSSISCAWPQLHIHAFSPPEVFFWSEKFGLPVAEVLRRLKAAGLQSLPGGGAEILHTGVRAQVSPNKCTAEQWLGVMEEAHKLGLRTTATMVHLIPPPAARDCTAPSRCRSHISATPAYSAVPFSTGRH